jgi:hypothetical protein
MGWGSGIVQGKEVGYLIEATCEHPDCDAKIDRGISYACGGFPGEDENSCDGFFCEAHLDYYLDDADEMSPQLCAKCGLRWERGEEGLTWIEEQEILDLVVETLFEDLRGHLKKHEYEKVDDFLRAVKIDDADDAILVALLRETASKKHVLPGREVFLTRVRAKVREHKSERETEKLLGGL